MSGPDAEDGDAIHSFGSLHALLGARAGQLTPAAERFLQQQTDALGRCYDVFGQGSVVSKAKEQQDGSKQETNEKELAKQIAERFGINQDSASGLLRSFRNERGDNVATDLPPECLKDESLWSQINGFFFDERLNVILTVALLLRIGDGEDIVSQETLQATLQPIITDAFTKAVLSRITALSILAVPDTAFPADWAKQYLREQKALLEVYFLLFYNNIRPNGKTLIEVLEAVQQMAWGEKQVNESYFDSEAYLLASEISTLLSIILLEHLNLESAIQPNTPDFDTQSTAANDPAELIQAVNLEKIHTHICALYEAHPQRAGPAVIGWAFILSLVTESLSARHTLDAYSAVACDLLPLDQQPHDAQGRLFKDGNRNQRPFYQALTETAVNQLAAVEGIRTVLTSPLFRPSAVEDGPQHASIDPMIPGYLSIMHSLISAVPKLVHPAYLSPTDFDALVEAFVALYSNSAAGMLRGHFWNLFDTNDEAVFQGEWDILEVAKRRFPLVLTPFLRMLHAVSGGPTMFHYSPRADEHRDEEELSMRCCLKVHDYLASVSSIAQAMPASSPLVPLPYESSTDFDAGPMDVTALREISVTDSVSIPTGTPGRIVSNVGERPPIILWDLASTYQGGYSVWQLFGDILADVVDGDEKANPSRKREVMSSKGTDDVFCDDSRQLTKLSGKVVGTNEEDQATTLATIFSITRDILSHDPGRADKLVQTMSAGSSRDFVELLFRAKEKYLAQQSAEEKVILPLLSLLGFLLPMYPGLIWTHLRGTTSLYPAGTDGGRMIGSVEYSKGRSILLHDKLAGKYSITLATVDLARSLFLEAQRSSIVDPPRLSELKAQVLKRAMRWCADSVWINLNSWRFVDIKQKMKLQARLAALFTLVLEESDVADSVRGEAVTSALDLILIAFIKSPTPSHLAPLTFTISTYYDTIFAFAKSGRTLERLAAEHSLEAILQLAYQLLSMSRSIVPDQPTLLERQSFSFQLGNGRNLIASLQALISANFRPEIAMLSASILTRLAYLAKDWGVASERPSFLAHLAGPSESEAVVRNLLTIAVDRFIDERVQDAVWGLMIGIIQYQPGLGTLLVCGPQAYARLLSAEVSEHSQPNTALALAVEVVLGWQSAWLDQPSLLSRALDLLLAVWDSDNDWTAYIDKCRMRTSLWQAVCQILLKPVTPDSGRRDLILKSHPATDSSSATVISLCHRLTTQVAAAKLLVLDLARSEFANVSKVHESTTVLRTQFGVNDSITSILQGLSTIPLDATESMHLQSRLQDISPRLNFRAFEKPVYHFDTNRQYGEDYLISLTLLRPRLDGCHSKQHGEAVVEAFRATIRLNESWSIYETTSQLLSLWTSLLQHGRSVLASMTNYPQELSNAAIAISASAATSDLGTDIAKEYQRKRLCLLRLVVDQFSRLNVPFNDSQLAALLAHLAALLGNITMNDTFESESKGGSPLAVLAFEIAAIILRFQCTPPPATEPKASLQSSIETITCLSLHAARTALAACTVVGAKASRASTLDSIVSTLRSAFAADVPPRPALWAAQCQDLDLFNVLSRYLAACPADKASAEAGRLALDLAALLAADPVAAERIALSGITYAICTSPLSAAVIDPVARKAHDAGLLLSQVWCSTLALETQMISHMSHSVIFAQEDTAPFILYYQGLLNDCLLSLEEDALSLSQLNELHLCATYTKAVTPSIRYIEDVEHLFLALVDGSLHVVQKLLHFLHHPNRLVDSITPADAVERLWLQTDSSASDTAPLSNLAERPVAGALLQKILGVSEVLITMLVHYTSTFSIIARDPLDWPGDRLLLQAVDDDDEGGPATVGTLLSLAAFCTEVLRQSGSKKTHVKSKVGTAPLSFDLERFQGMATYLREASLLLACSQTGLAVHAVNSLGMSDRTSEDAREGLYALSRRILDALNTTGGDSKMQQSKAFFSTLAAFMQRSQTMLQNA